MGQFCRTSLSEGHRISGLAHTKLDAPNPRAIPPPSFLTSLGWGLRFLVGPATVKIAAVHV